MTRPYDYRTALGEPPFHIISMDGGGIYGRVTAGLLRRLCEQQQDAPADGELFLHPHRGQRFTFAGTSAGALNALLLASHQDPRAFVLSGELEAFWADPRIYSNTQNPVHAVTSLMGLTGWLGSEDFLQLLRETFQDKTLADLEHNVLVTAFNFAGATKPITGLRQWMPETHLNFGRSTSPSMPIVELAYAACSPPPLRAIHGGLGDGGVFAPNPSDNVLTKIIFLITTPADHAPAKSGAGAETNDSERPLNFFRLLHEQSNQGEPKYPKPPPEVLADLYKIALLSVGVGYHPPHYSLSNFDFGVLPFSTYPTNIADYRYLPAPLTMGLDASSEIAERRTSQLLGPNNFRLNPPLLRPPAFPPALLATALSRFDPWRSYFVTEIDKALETNQARAHIDRALRFVNSNEWNIR